MDDVNRMNVATGFIQDGFGGVSQHILALKKYSTNNVQILPHRPVRLVLYKNPVVFANTLLAKNYYRVLKKVTLRRYNVIHSHPDPLFIKLCALSQSPKCKWVHTYHTLYFKEDNYPPVLERWQEQTNKILLEIGSKADVTVSVSRWLHDLLLNDYVIDTRVIPNGVDVDACNRANADFFTKKFGVANFVLFTGYLDSIKNPALFVELAARLPEIKFMMIGRGITPANLIAVCKSPLPKNLILLTELPHKELLNAILACKAYVMTSRREGCPTALLEAMALRKPVVVPSHSGCKEIVPSAEFGFPYEPNSLDALVEQTLNALDSRNVGQKARERVLQHYDWTILAKKIDALYVS